LITLVNTIYAHYRCQFSGLSLRVQTALFIDRNSPADKAGLRLSNRSAMTASFVQHAVVRR
jgi:hypothetical protein